MIVHLGEAIFHFLRNCHLEKKRNMHENVLSIKTRLNQIYARNAWFLFDSIFR